MSLTGGHLDALLAAGATAEQIVALVKADMAERERSLGARRAKDAERQRRKRSRGVTRTERDACDKGSPEVSPRTPLPNPSKITPLNPPKSGRSLIPADWTPPAVSSLPPRAKALAEQWTNASYQTQAEGFVLYWRNERKMRPDWTGTWANWIIRIHGQVMRDQKFGNAPTEITKPVAVTPDTYLRLAAGCEERGRLRDAAKYREMAEAMEKPPDPVMGGELYR